jgi:HEAT repeat protein
MPNLQDLLELPSWDWPADAADRIKGALAVADHEDMGTVVELAGDLVVMDDEIAGLLLGVLRGDSPDDVRGRAAIALGPALEEAGDLGFDEEFDSQFDTRVLSEARVNEIQSILRGLHDDENVPLLVRRRALEASIREPREWHAEAVRQAYGRADKDWKLTAIFCMGHFAEFAPEVVESLDAAEVDLMVEAVRAAGMLGMGEAGPRVLELAADESQAAAVRYAAVEALANLETPGSDELLVALTESEDDALAELAYESLEERRVFSEPPDTALE